MLIFDEIGNPFDVDIIEKNNVVEPPIDLTITTPENLCINTNCLKSLHDNFESISGSKKRCISTPFEQRKSTRLAQMNTIRMNSTI
jgi:hypothetical protein